VDAGPSIKKIDMKGETPVVAQKGVGTFPSAEDAGAPLEELTRRATPVVNQKKVGVSPGEDKMAVFVAIQKSIEPSPETATPWAL
jgi:hypothetical protein